MNFRPYWDFLWILLTLIRWVGIKLLHFFEDIRKALIFRKIQEKSVYFIKRPYRTIVHGFRVTSNI